MKAMIILSLSTGTSLMNLCVVLGVPVLALIFAGMYGRKNNRKNPSE